MTVVATRRKQACQKWYRHAEDHVEEIIEVEDVRSEAELLGCMRRRSMLGWKVKTVALKEGIYLSICFAKI